MNDWIPAADAAREFDLDFSTIPHAIRAGHIKGKKLARMWFVRRTDVAKLPRGRRGPYKRKKSNSTAE